MIAATYIVGMHQRNEAFSLELPIATDGAAVRTGIRLSEPRGQLRIRDPRRLGRAEAQFGGQRWAAKHYWAEGSDADRITIYEFDELLPAGDIELVVPVES